MTNTDRVVELILKNTKDLPATKIKALAEVVKSLGGEIEKAPNDVPAEADPNLMDETAPIDLSKVKKIEIDGRETDLNIYKN